MSEPTGTWSQIEVAGHACRVFEPAAPSPHGYIVVYLHCSEAASLRGYPAFVQRVRAPRPARDRTRDRPKLVDRPHLARVRSGRFRPKRTCCEHVVPYVAERWNARPPQLALLGVSMGGQGALRMAYKYPNVFPDRGRDLAGDRFSEADRRRRRPRPRLHVPRRRRRPARHGTAAHPSAQLAAEPILLLRPDRRALARIGRPAADEALVARRAVRMRPGNRSRRPQLRVRLATWPSAPSASSPNDSTKNAAECSIARLVPGQAVAQDRNAGAGADTARLI